jgi:WD40 repeat protein
MDKSLICWNIAKKTLIFKSFGHDGTITSITIHDTLLFTGSVDKSVIVWSSHDGQMLKQLRGHSRGILGVTTWPSYFASADADGEISIWNHEVRIHAISLTKLSLIIHSIDCYCVVLIKYSCYKRLQLIPRNRISVIRCGQQELVCGDSAGYISVFWLETENIIRQSKVHDSLVTDLSFDASKIVTCSTDGTVKVLDMLSCQILHTLRAGDAPIYSVYFDKIHIIFLSLDGKIQQWLWESTDEHSQDGYKYHVVSERDTTKSICKQFGLNVRQLLKMNPDQDLKNLKIGTKVLVVKPNSKNDTSKKNVRFDTRSKFRNAVIEPLEGISPSEEDTLRPNILIERTSLASRLIN